MDLVMGLDFGTDSVRAVAVDAATGRAEGEGLCFYPRWREQRYCDANSQVFRQHPLDYVESMTSAVRAAVGALAPEKLAAVRAVAVDATGSTVCPVGRDGRPLSLRPEFSGNPDAMFHLWKDHSAAAEAREINEVFTSWGGDDYTRYQGQYSSEWMWAKALRTVRRDADIRREAISWVELADWIPALLTGRIDPDTMYRCFCAAGHKALWHSAFGGLPARECLAKLDPALAEVAAHYAAVPGMSTDRVGPLTDEWRGLLGLPPGVIVGGSSLDAHAGAVGAGVAPGTLVKVIGTSTVDMAVVGEAEIEGKSLRTVCGLAQNSILPGYIGLEAGQSAFGDVFAWFRRLLMWAVDDSQALAPAARDALFDRLLARLEEAMPPDDVPFDVVALDWFNGRRYPDNDDSLHSAVMGLSLGTDAPRLYRALVLAAVFGARAVVEGIAGAGIELRDVIAVGGIAQKSPYVMQLMADALGRVLRVSQSKQTCALGAAMYAAVAAGLHPDLLAAQKRMGSGFSREYRPDPARRALLEPLYGEYRRLAVLTDAWFAGAGE